MNFRRNHEFAKDMCFLLPVFVASKRTWIHLFRMVSLGVLPASSSGTGGEGLIYNDIICPLDLIG